MIIRSSNIHDTRHSDSLEGMHRGRDLVDVNDHQQDLVWLHQLCQWLRAER